MSTTPEPVKEGVGVTPTMPDEVREKAREVFQRALDTGGTAWTGYAEDAVAAVAYAAGQQEAAKRAGYLCEPCERNDHDACTGYCQGSCCPAYAAGRADERAGRPDGRPTLVGQADFLTDKVTKVAHAACARIGDYTPLRDRHRGRWFEVRVGDGEFVIRVTVEMDRYEPRVGRERGEHLDD